MVVGVGRFGSVEFGVSCIFIIKLIFRVALNNLVIIVIFLRCVFLGYKGRGGWFGLGRLSSFGFLKGRDRWVSFGYYLVTFRTVIGF